MSESDAPTVVVRLPRHRPTADVWDELLHVARRVEYTRTGTVVGRSSYWWLPAIATTLICVVGMAGPGMWTDELATWGMATTSWHEFWPVLRYVDAVLAPYYVFMHAWVSVFGDSDIALRAPSVIAMAVSAGLIAHLGGRLAGPRAGALAGLVFAVLPSTSRFAAEARPYAPAVLAAVVATVLLVRAWDRPTVLRWSAYAAAVAVLGALHIVGLLLLAAHAWVLLAWRRRLWWHMAVAAFAAVAANAPLFLYGAQQRHQVAYIPRVTMASAAEYADVVFGGAIICLIVIVFALFSLPLRYPSAIFTAWAIIPALALIAFSFAMPMFLPRYLLYTSPGWALLAGLALSRIRLPWAVVALTVVAMLGLPAQAAMRRDDGHQQATQTFAAIIAAKMHPGDGVVYADEEPVGSWTGRDMLRHYLPPARRPIDVLATNPPRHNGLLLATETKDVTSAIRGTDRLWVLRLDAGADPLAAIGPAKEAVLRQQFDVAYIWRSSHITLALLQRRST
jgi:mannosyltransferase